MPWDRCAAGRSRTKRSTEAGVRLLRRVALPNDGPPPRSDSRQPAKRRWRSIWRRSSPLERTQNALGRHHVRDVHKAAAIRYTPAAVERGVT